MLSSTSRVQFSLFSIKLALFCANLFDFGPNKFSLEPSVVLLLCFLENTVVTATTAVTLPVFLQKVPGTLENPRDFFSDFNWTGLLIP